MLEVLWVVREVVWVARRSARASPPDSSIRHAAGGFTMQYRGARAAAGSLIGLAAVLAVWHPAVRGVEPVFQPPPIEVPPGFVVELVAAPPLVYHPVMAGFDERGRLLVADNAGVNLKADELLAQRPNMVRMLEDLDGDGRFDRSTLFADQMTFPQGALWYRGALYVASPPHIWRLEDTDGDGVADRRDELVGRFGFIGNAADIHGCFLGPEGRIYWCDGRHGHDIPQGDGHGALRGHAARVFSCRPDGSDVQVYCGGGMDNPVEVAFTAEGDMLGTMTFYNPDRDRHDALVHFVWGGVYPKKHPCIDEFKRTGELMPPLSLFGVVAPSGLTRYRGTQWGPQYRDNFFSTQFNTHKVVRHIVAREGATFTCRDEDFLVSSSIDFHPTDVLQDADGSLLVIDTGGWFRIGCPTSQVAKPDILGAIYRIRRTEAPRVDDPRGLRLAWDASASHEELCRRLADGRPAVRDRALDLLAQRGEAAVAPLQRVLRQHDDPDVRRRAVWSLVRIASPSARAAVREALQDASPSVQQAAALGAAAMRDAQAVGPLVQRLTALDTTPAVRREAATSLGRLGDAAAVPALLAALRTGGDRFLEHALIYALIELDVPQATRAGLHDPSPLVRRGALVALDQMDHSDLARDEVARLLDTDDRALQQAALQVLARRGWSAEVVQLLTAWLGDPAAAAQQEASLRGVLLAFAADESVQALLAEKLASDRTSPWLRGLLLEVVARCEVAQLPAAWRQPLAAALRGDDPAQLRLAVDAAARWNDAAFDAELLNVGRSVRYPPALRVAALAAVAARLPALTDADFQLLLSQLEADVLPLQRLAAAQTLAAARLDAQQRGQLLPAVAQAGPLELPLLLRGLAAGGDAALGARLLAAVEKSPGLANLDPLVLESLLSRFPQATRDAAAPLLRRLAEQHAQQREHLKSLLALLDSDGDPDRGRALFFSHRTNCTACHRLQGQGEAIGPDLSRIGQVRAPRDLLEAIVLPSASLARGYETYTIATRDGHVVTGIVSRETPSAIYVRTAERLEVRLPREQIDEMTASRTSIMPQGLEKSLSPQELRDLIAFLGSLR
jgi:putative membrane-bound dehydrogenase-like protein